MDLCSVLGAKAQHPILRHEQTDIWRDFAHFASFCMFLHPADNPPKTRHKSEIKRDSSAAHSRAAARVHAVCAARHNAECKLISNEISPAARAQSNAQNRKAAARTRTRERGPSCASIPPRFVNKNK